MNCGHTHHSAHLPVRCQGVALATQPVQYNYTGIQSTLGYKFSTLTSYQTPPQCYVNRTWINVTVLLMLYSKCE